MQVELITIGDELLLGFTLDSNAAFLSRELASLGVRVARRVTIGDEPGDIRSAVLEALERSDGVITTGGLGPTSDDVTRRAVADALGIELRRDDRIVKRLEALWRSRKRTDPLPASNLVQAMVPEGATVLDNPNGTAPGIWIDRPEGRWLAMLPGVPGEMRAMFRACVAPRLASAANDTVIRSLTIRTTGIAESQLPDRLGELAGGDGDVTLAYLPSVDGVDLRLTVRGVPAAEADAALAASAGRLRAKLGDVAYGSGDDDLAAVVLSACRDRGHSLAVGESCTGGMIGARVTAIPGSSDVFRGGVVAYDDEVKIRQLGVEPRDIQEHGAVSEEVVTAMAAGACEKLGASVGIGVTGIAGPGGGTPEKPVGLVWIAVVMGDRRSAREFRFFGDRDDVRRRATQAALDFARRKIAG